MALTGTDSSVFIRWLRMTVEPHAEGGPYTVTLETEVSIAGERISSPHTYVAATVNDIYADMADALEEKRLEYVSV